MKTGLDDYLVQYGALALRGLIKSTPYEESLMELQQTSIKLLDFSEKYDFKFQHIDNKTLFTKSSFKLSKEGSDTNSLIALYRDENLIIKEKLNLTLGTKKDSFVKRCNLDDISSREIRKFLDIILEFTTLQKGVLKLESKIKKEIDAKYPINSSISEKKRDKALKLAKSPDLLFQLKTKLEQLGLVGEFLNGLLIYLALTSRLLEKPISIILKAGSAAGKSYLVKIALKLFPAEAYIELTGLSPKALIYLNEPFKHRFLIIFEIHGVKEDDYTEHMIRTLLSENKIRYAVVERNDSDSHETIIIEREGPTGLITTTTFASIHDENETRLFSITINESNEQTKNIKEKIAVDYLAINTDAETDDLEDLINLQKILEPLLVIIPFAKELAELTPDEPIRMRRDFQRILAVVEVIALLHQHQREVKEENGVKFIEAKLEDYYTAKKLLEEPLNLTLCNKYPQTIELVNTVKELHDQNGEYVKIKELQEKLKKNKTTITRWLRPAVENGWIENIGEEGSGKPFKLIPGKIKDIEDSLLPTFETLAEKFPHMAMNFDVIDPITGKEIKAKWD